MVNPFLSASRGIEDCGVRCGWDAKETEDSLDMETLDNTIIAHNHEEAASSLLGLNDQAELGVTFDQATRTDLMRMCTFIMQFDILNNLQVCYLQCCPIVVCCFVHLGVENEISLHSLRK